jgi:nucleoside-diphosphate-sugar epimerase
VEDVVSTMTANPLARDLDHVLARTGGLWEDLRGARLFITGGTGFFGCWLLETFLWANDHLNLGASALVLTRDREAFAKKVPHLAGHSAVTLHAGDLATFDLADEPVSHVIHAAADASPVVDRDDRLRMFDTIVNGTRRTLELARRSGATRFLLTSSGAVYGTQPPEVRHVGEEYPGAPDCTQAAQAYGEAKRAAEALCAVYADARLQPTIARCFAFVGPYLPLDANFAAGNFIRDALRGGPIRISGDGTPRRSYLYAADLAVWLWTILLRGQPCRPYNVGSPHDLSIRELAETVASLAGFDIAIQMGRLPVAGAAHQRYVPDTRRAVQELGLGEVVSLNHGIQQTLAWYRGRDLA